MDLSRKMNQIVITYSDGECLVAEKEEAQKIQRIIRLYMEAYIRNIKASELNGTNGTPDFCDLTNDIVYTKIRARENNGHE